MSQQNHRANRWAIVLAGGEGERLRPFVERCFGAPRPKQYCSFTGGKTMLEHTWERAIEAAHPSRIITLIGRGHRAHLPDAPPPGLVLDQPERRETGPGIYLPLTHVLARDSAAVTAIFPSDHFIRPNEKFQERLEEAFTLAELLPGHIVLLAARPERAEPDYGWIQPGPALPGFRRAFAVKAFREKPRPEEAAGLSRQGALCNTMIVVARAAALWNLAWELKPSLMSRFEALRPWIGAPREAEILSAVYARMESSNFSRDILEHAAARTVMLRLDDVAWCDWGRPERILETLRSLNIVFSPQGQWLPPMERSSTASAAA